MAAGIGELGQEILDRIAEQPRQYSRDKTAGHLSLDKSGWTGQTRQAERTGRPERDS